MAVGTLHEQALSAMRAHSEITSEPREAVVRRLVRFQEHLFSSGRVRKLARALAAGEPLPNIDPPLNAVERQGKTTFEQFCASCHGGAAQTVNADARFLPVPSRGLARFSRLILFDKRGTGLSDPVTQMPALEQRMDDVRAVMDTVGSQRAVLLGVSEGGPLCSLFAATYPDRTEALVMVGTYARRTRTADYPWAPTDGEREVFCREILAQWGGPVGIEVRAPSRPTMRRSATGGLPTCAWARARRLRWH